ncbi:hypothetical protein BCE02nite_57730 [Brevibacillus centrosporus]|nr:hypothetical protein BCE02nite_57730 [Brevibacillus centrosporus]
MIGCEETADARNREDCQTDQQPFSHVLASSFDSLSDSLSDLYEWNGLVEHILLEEKS